MQKLARGMAVRLMAAVFVACAMCASVGAAPQSAYADAAVYTASATAYYANPDTGVIEDSGGEGSAALGQSMADGILQPQAFVEKDVDGRTFVTVRLYQANEIGDVVVSSDPSHSGSFGAASLAANMSMDASANMGDWLFETPSEGSTFRLTMYVEPMGREVTFFVLLDGFQEGNSAGFVQTVGTSGPAAPEPEEAQSPDALQDALEQEQSETSDSQTPDSPSESNAESADAEGSASAAAEASSSDAGNSSLQNGSGSSGASASAQASSPSSASSLVEGAPAASSGSDDSSLVTGSSVETGVSEYDADGNQVQGDAAGAPSVNVPLVAGILVALAAVVAGIVYVLRRPTRDAAAAAAAAAAAPDSVADANLFNAPETELLQSSGVQAEADFGPLPESERGND